MLMRFRKPLYYPSTWRPFLFWMPLLITLLLSAMKSARILRSNGFTSTLSAGSLWSRAALTLSRIPMGTWFSVRTSRHIPGDLDSWSMTSPGPYNGKVLNISELTRVHCSIQSIVHRITAVEMEPIHGDGCARSRGNLGRVGHGWTHRVSSSAVALSPVFVMLLRDAAPWHGSWQNCNGWNHPANWSTIVEIYVVTENSFSGTNLGWFKVEYNTPLQKLALAQKTIFPIKLSGELK